MVLLPEDEGELPITRALGDLRMKAVDPRDRLKPEMQASRQRASPPARCRRGSGALTSSLPRLRRPPPAPLAQVVSSTPEVCVVRRSALSAGFLIIASDGVWSCCKSDEAYALVQSKLAVNDNPQWAADQLLAHVVNEQQTSDNVFITVVLLKPAEQPRHHHPGGTPGAALARLAPAHEQAATCTPPTNSPLVAAQRQAAADAELRGPRSAPVAPPAGVATFSQQSVRVGES